MGGMFGGLFSEGGPMGAGAGLGSDDDGQQQQQQQQQQQGAGGTFGGGVGGKRPRAAPKVEVDLKLRLEDMYRWVWRAGGVGWVGWGGVAYWDGRAGPGWARSWLDGLGDSRLSTAWLPALLAQLRHQAASVFPPTPPLLIAGAPPRSSR
jgi:hypothetical protein